MGKYKSDVGTFEIEGLKELDKLLSELDTATQAKIYRSANRQGAKIILNEMRSNLPEAHKDDVKNLRIAADKYNKSAVLVGVHSDGFKLRWVEYGTVQRTTKSGANRGVFAPTPFLEKSLDNTANQVINFLRNEYANEINKAIEKTAKRVQKKNSKI